MLSIHLQNIRLRAGHGIHPEEKILGNEFLADITIRYLPQQVPVLHLSETIDYAEVYDLVVRLMAIPTPLLETVVTNMARAILVEFPRAEEVAVSLQKLHPPISRLHGSVAVSFELKRNQL